MDRAVVIAFAVLGVALAGVIGLGIGFAYVSGDPALQVQRRCSSGQMGPPGGCHNLKFTSQTGTRVAFTYDLSDGSHCVGSWESHRAGFGLASGGGGGEACGAPGQPIPGLTGPPARPTPLPDGNLPCTYGQASITNVLQTQAGFSVQVTNRSATACDLIAPAKMVFLDRTNRDLGIRLIAASEPGTQVVLAPGAVAAFAFDNGSGQCQTVSQVIIAAQIGGPPTRTPGLRACSPVTSHQPALLPQSTG